MTFICYSRVARVTSLGGSHRGQTEGGLRLVTASKMIQRSIEELSDLVVEFLDAVQLERQELLGGDAIAGKV